VTFNPASSKHGNARWRFWFVTVAAVAGVAITLRLGVWQLSRADEKLTLQAQILAQSHQSPLQAAEALADPQQWGQTHRPVELRGQWLNEKTIYLDNRNHHGKPGFWVMTPLRWSPGQVVWVQRGWVQRDLRDARQASPVFTPIEDVLVQGRIAPPLSHMVELATTEPVTSVNGLPVIQANLDMAQMKALVNDNVNALVIQTGQDTDGLRRDWPVIAQSADKNKGYAFQWFALSALIAMLYLWFQWIQPIRHARTSN
jgi:cytochrome oxidase assembly protein ShyY1